MSWLLIGIGVVVAAVLIYLLASSSKERSGTLHIQEKETPATVARIAEVSHHGARVGAIQGNGLSDALRPFTGTVPRRKTKKD